MKLILYHQNLENEENLLNSFLPNCVLRNAKNFNTIEDLLNSITNLNEITHLALVYHSTQNYKIPFFTTNDKEYYFFNTNLVNLFIELKKYNSNLIVDLLTCNLVYSAFQIEAQSIQENLQINIRYSINLTGNLNGDWILESDNFDVKDLYFTSNINNWSNTLYDPSANGTVWTINYDSEKVYVGGEFTSFNGVARNYLVRLDMSGTTDNTWTFDTGNDFGGLYGARVEKIHSDETHIYIGGWFTDISGVNRRRVARINKSDNTLDSWNPNLVWDSDTNYGFVKDIATDSSFIYLVGDFNKVGGTSGTSRSRIARWNKSTGVLDSWNPTVNSGITAIHVDSSFIYIGGFFTQVNSTTRNRIARLSKTDGSLDTWNPGSDAELYTMNGDENYLYCGGGFTTISSASRGYGARFNKSTGNIDTWNPNADSVIYNFAFDNSYIYIVGLFNNLLSTSRNRIARINKSNSSLDSTFDPNSNNDINTISLALGNVYTYIGGGFTQISSLTANRFKILSREVNINANLGSGTNNIVDICYNNVTVKFPTNNGEIIFINSTTDISDVVLGISSEETSINSLNNLIIYTLEPSGTFFSDYISFDICVNSINGIVVYYNTGTSTTLLTDNSNNSTNPYYIIEDLSFNKIKVFTKSFSDIILGNSNSGIGDPLIKPIFGDSYYLPNDESTYLLLSNKDNLNIYTKTWIPTNIKDGTLSFMRYLIIHFNSERACLDLDTMNWVKVTENNYFNHSLKIIDNPQINNMNYSRNKFSNYMNDYYNKNYKLSKHNKQMSIIFDLEDNKKIELKIISDMKYQDIRNNINILIKNINQQELINYEGAFIHEKKSKKINPKKFFDKINLMR
jgi:hypothetical protein